VPAYLDSHGKPSLPLDAKYVLHEVTTGKARGKNGKANYVSTMTNESLYVYYVQYGEVIGVYVDTDKITIWQERTMAATGAAIAGNFRAALSVTNNVDFYAHDLTHTTVNAKLDWEGLSLAISNLETSRSHSSTMFTSGRENSKLQSRHSNLTE